MPNYDGLSPEEKKRHQAAHEHVSTAFKRALRGETRATNAPRSNGHNTGKTLIFVLRPDGSTQFINTAVESRRVEQNKKAAAYYKMKQEQKVDLARQKGALMKEFSRSATRNRSIDQER